MNRINTYSSLAHQCIRWSVTLKFNIQVRPIGFLIIGFGMYGSTVSYHTTTKQLAIDLPNVARSLIHNNAQIDNKLLIRYFVVLCHWGIHFRGEASVIVQEVMTVFSACFPKQCHHFLFDALFQLVLEGLSPRHLFPLQYQLNAHKSVSFRGLSHTHSGVSTELIVPSHGGVRTLRDNKTEVFYKQVHSLETS